MFSQSGVMARRDSLRAHFTPFSPKRILLYLALVFVIAPLFARGADSQPAPQHIAAPAVDPDKPSSEMNHHIAGMFLIAIGLSVILSKRYQSLAWLRWLPPLLFIAAGLFLAAWSDDEIWPRGDLSWSWLLRHDAEARQHKLYALLLLTIGLVEAVQASSRLRRPWLSVALPVLGVIGGAGLLLHQHGAHVSANAVAQTAPSSAIADGSHSRQLAAQTMPEHQHAGGGPPHSHPRNIEKANTASTGHAQHHENGLTGPMENIQRQHTWFAVSGFCIALLKLLHDTARPPARVRQYLWPGSLIVLGLLLLLYTE